jgi:hypothetical protein
MDALIASVTPEHQALLLALAQQAAAWWRHKVAGPGYLSKFDNGDRSRAGEMVQVMAAMRDAKVPSPDVSVFDRFEQLLSAHILRKMLANPLPERPESLTFRVDYGPEYELAEIAREAGVSGFPFKTTMYLRWAADPAECYVEVKAGYGRAYERLPAVEQEPPATDC